MYLTDGNPVLENYRKIKSGLTLEQKTAIDALYEEKAPGFIVLKRTRREKRVGDVFVCSVQEGVYYYGKILNNCIEADGSGFYDGNILVVLYRGCTKRKTMDDFVGDINNIMFAPKIVFPQSWSNGYFETIGNVPLTDEEKTFDYGFWKEKGISGKGYFVKENGSIMEHMPKCFSIYSITTYFGFSRLIKEAIIIDPSLAIVKNN